jgi:ABC-type transport system involved in Fe-S cluster assembly fused permease/ATPase subunit
LGAIARYDFQYTRLADVLAKALSQGPLVYFSGVYKNISESLMDAERLLDIFQTKPSVADKKGAKPLAFVKGDIKFNNVDFSYDERKGVLKAINLQVAGGSTVAIVGETGSGKSTILKLLHRFYDVKSGGIEIDGHDIRDVTLKR